MNAKCPKQFTPKHLSTPSSLRQSNVANASPAFATRISNLFGPASSFALRLSAELFALRTHARSSSWNSTDPELFEYDSWA